MSLWPSSAGASFCHGCGETAPEDLIGLVGWQGSQSSQTSSREAPALPALGLLYALEMQPLAGLGWSITRELMICSRVYFASWVR